MFNNPYYGNNQLNMDRIDSQIKELENMRAQLQQKQQPSINQTFQLAPTHSTMRFADTYEEVKREIVYTDTPFFSKDFSVMWIKTAKGEVKPYELKEIIEKDDKDLKIEYLEKELEELKGMMKNEQRNTDANREDVSESSSDGDETTRK